MQLGSRQIWQRYWQGTYHGRRECKASGISRHAVIVFDEPVVDRRDCHHRGGDIAMAEGFLCATSCVLCKTVWVWKVIMQKLHKAHLNWLHLSTCMGLCKLSGL